MDTQSKETFLQKNPRRRVILSPTLEGDECTHLRLHAQCRVKAAARRWQRSSERPGLRFRCLRHPASGHPQIRRFHASLYLRANLLPREVRCLQNLDLQVTLQRLWTLTTQRTWNIFQERRAIKRTSRLCTNPPPHPLQTESQTSKDIPH